MMMWPTMHSSLIRTDGSDSRLESPRPDGGESPK